MKMVMYMTVWGVFWLVGGAYSAVMPHTGDIADKKLVKLWEIKTPLDDFCPRCTFSCDGKYFLYPEHNSIIIYDFRQRKRVDKITYDSTGNKSDTEFKCVAISPDNKHIAATLFGGNLKVWSYPSKKLVLDCKGFEYYCSVLKKVVSSDEGYVFFTKDNRYLIVNNDLVGVRVWAVKQDVFKEVYTFYDADLAIVPGSRFCDSNYLVLHYGDGDPNEEHELKKYDLRTMKCVGTFPNDASFYSSSPDENETICRDYHGDMVLYNWKAKERKVFKCPYASHFYYYSPSGRHIVAVGHKANYEGKNITGYCLITAYNRKMDVVFREKFDFQKCDIRKKDGQISEAVKGFFSFIYFSPDGKVLAICSDEAIRFYKNPF